MTLSPKSGSTTTTPPPTDGGTSGTSTGGTSTGGTSTGGSTASGDGSVIGNGSTGSGSTAHGPTPPPYGYSIAAVETAKVEGDSGPTTFTFTVTRFGDLSTATSITWGMQPGSALGTATNVVNGADFGAQFLPGGTVDFTIGETTRTLTITVAGDTLAETDEQFTVTLGGAGFTSATKPPDWADRVTATIINDDAAVSATYSLGWGSGGNLGSVAFAEQGDGVTPTTINFTVTRSGDLATAGSVNWSILGSGGVPATGADFVGGALPSGMVQFAAGEISATIPIPILNDYITEPTEGFQILLSNPSAGTGVDVGVLNRSIIDNDTATGFTIVADTASVLEGQPGTTTPYTFTIYRSGDVSSSASVGWYFEYASGFSTPALSGDFVPGSPLTGTVSFAPGENSQTVTLQVMGDLEYEGNEAFAVKLRDPSVTAPFLVGSANGVIVNDDPSTPAVHLSVVAPDVVKAEGDSGTTPFTFTITRTGDLTYGGTVGWNVAVSPTTLSLPNTSLLQSGTALQGSVTFAPGQATQDITLNVVGDTVYEPDMGFAFSLSNIPGGYDYLPGQGWISAIVLNDDAAPDASVFSIAPLQTALAEGNSGITDFSFVVSRVSGANTTASVQWGLTFDPNSPARGIAHLEDVFYTNINSPSAGSTIVWPGGTVTFAPGEMSQTVVMPVTGDITSEPDEVLTVALWGASYGSSIGTGTASSTILNDDAAPPAPIDYTGTSGNDTISFATATSGKWLDLGLGGSDAATGSAWNDTFVLGGAFNSTDKINGGGGNDTLMLFGDYTGGISLRSSTVTNVETLVLAAGHSYNITTNSATVAAGATLTVDASTLAAVNSATVNGAAEGNGRFVFLGGAGADNFTGGGGADLFVGGTGGDALKGNGGADIFRYLAAGDSPFALINGALSTSAIDRIASFQAGTDRLDFAAFGFAGAAANVLTRSTSALSTNLSNGTGFYGTAGVAVEQGRLSGTLTTRVFVDANHDGNLGIGDAVIQLTGVSAGAFTQSSVTFS